jgi:hypothetical protein
MLVRRLRVLVPLLLLVPTLAAAPSVAGGVKAAAAPKIREDFNRDGFADLAVGVPEESLGTASDAGGVHVIYGSAGGLTASGNQFWTQDSAGVPTDPQDIGNFGGALAAGDFNGDGFGDLAVGAPGQTLGGLDQAGVVIVLYGTHAGLSSNGAQLIDQDTEGILETAEDGDRFGAALVAGNFGHSSHDDLAIGAGGEDLGTTAEAGVVQVLYGSITGLSPIDNQLWSENTPGVAGDGAETDDEFGGRFLGTGKGLAAADFGKDGHDDLAIGIPAEDVGAKGNAGAVLVLYGSSGGLTEAASQFWTQDSAGIQETAQAGDDFGWAVAGGNFGKDGHADLAIGAPFETVGPISQCGAVNVIYGSSGGLTPTGNQLWTQDSPSVKDQCQSGAGFGDDFGFSLSAADLGKSSQVDLAIGAFGEDVGTAANAGAINVLYGTGTGLSAAGNQFWTQDSTGVKDKAEGTGSSTVSDVLGFDVIAANFGKSAQADVAAAAIGEDLVGNSLPEAGAINVLYGTSTGLAAAGNQFWTQDSAGVKDQAEPNDRFGEALANG